MHRTIKLLLLLIVSVMLLLAVATAYATAPTQTTGMYQFNTAEFAFIRQADGNSIWDETLTFSNNGTNPDDLTGPSTVHVTCVVRGVFPAGDWTCQGSEMLEDATLAGKVCDLNFNIVVKVDDAFGPNENLQGKWNITSGTCGDESVHGSGSFEGVLAFGEYNLNYHFEP